MLDSFKMPNWFLEQRKRQKHQICVPSLPCVSCSLIRPRISSAVWRLRFSGSRPQTKKNAPRNRGAAFSHKRLSIKHYSEMADNSFPILRKACPILCACASEIYVLQDLYCRMSPALMPAHFANLVTLIKSK